jgi:uncharacterized protein (DUF1778 family)
MALATRSSRKKRLDLRATARQRKLIFTVAERQGVSVTDFILNSACQQAEQILADQRHFSISEKRWKAFLEALDRPVQKKPELERLLSEPSVLEKK